VLRQGARLTVLGLAIGLPLALALSRVAGSVVHGISVTDPLTFVALPLVVVAATLVACARPAITAAATDPARVLRSE
jgi:ABC-type antimicrobial peptide transport system permease subunit